MRKVYIEEFNKCTNYIKIKNSNKNPNLLIECLEKYISNLNETSKFDDTMRQNLIFFLGAFIYPKHLKKITIDS